MNEWILFSENIHTNREDKYNIYTNYKVQNIFPNQEERLSSL
jgi:hypothetical protein